MKKRNVTRSALITSIISLLLCVSMLVGTTFAWFTDEVASGNNQIVAGNLDIDVLFANAPDGTYGSIEGKNDLFVAPAGITKGLWEPGHTEVAYLKVVNKGTLALKYQFMVDAASEVIGKSVEGDDIQLSKILQFAATAPSETAPAAYTRETAQAAAEEANGNLLGFTTGAQMLKAGEEVYVALVVYMPESVGNEANYRGDKIPTINFKLTAIATQVQAENDSFGKDYDAGAPWVGGVDTTWYDPNQTTYTLNSPEELAGFVALTNGTAEPGVSPYSMRAATPVDFKGKTVLLGNNMNLNNLSWTPAGTFKGTFDGQEHVIYNVNMSGNRNVAFFGDLNGKVQNLTLENVTAEGTKYVGAIAGYMIECGGIENCHVVNATITARPVADAEGVYDDGQHAGGLVAYADNSNITGCSVKKVKITAYRDLGGIVGTTTASAAKEAPVISNCSGSEILLGYVAAAPYNKETPNQNAGVIVGRKAKEPTIDQYTLDNVQEAPYQPVAEGVYQNGTTYYVDSAAGLSYFSTKALSGNNGVAETMTIELLGNIDMAGAKFSSVIAQRGDGLIFNGNGYKISNVNIVSGANDNTTGQAAMFYCYPNSTLTVSDLILENVKVTADNNDTGYAAAVVGFCEGDAVLNDVDVVNATVIGAKSSGMLAGHVGNGGSLNAENCDVTGTVTLSDYENGGHYAGKYVGTVADPVALTNCTANVTLGGNLNAKNEGNIYGRKTNSGSLTIDGALQQTAATQAELDAAVAASDNVNISLGEGNYTIPSGGAGKEITISGAGDNTVLDMTKVANANGASFTFENLKFQGTNANVMNGFGIQGTTGHIAYVNCTFDGAVTNEYYGSVSYEDCTFTGTGYITTYAVNSATFTNCVFDKADSRAVLVYCHGDIPCTVELTDCKFYADAKGYTWVPEWTAAVEVDTTNIPTVGTSVTINNCTHDSNYSGIVRDKSAAGKANAVITVDGVVQ